MAALNAKKVSKVKAFDADASYSVEGADGGSFAIASSKKDLKALMRSDVDVVYDEKKGKLYLNENGTAKGWGAKKVGGLIAKFKSKPELIADHFDGLSAHSDAQKSLNGGSPRTAPVLSRDVDGWDVQVISDEVQYLDEFTFKHELADDLIVRRNINPAGNKSIGIYSGEFLYKNGALNRAHIDEYFTGLVGDNLRIFKYWDFTGSPKVLNIDDALIASGLGDLPAANSEDEGFIISNAPSNLMDESSWQGDFMSINSLPDILI